MAVSRIMAAVAERIREEKEKAKEVIVREAERARTLQLRLRSVKKIQALCRGFLIRQIYFKRLLSEAVRLRLKWNLASIFLMYCRNIQAREMIARVRQLLVSPEVGSFNPSM